MRLGWIRRTLEACFYFITDLTSVEINSDRVKLEGFLFSLFFEKAQERKSENANYFIQMDKRIAE